MEMKRRLRRYFKHLLEGQSAANEADVESNKVIKIVKLFRVFILNVQLCNPYNSYGYKNIFINSNKCNKLTHLCCDKKLS